jgi:hypothetical protein
MVHQNGEQDVARRLGQRRVDRTERRARLVRIGMRGADTVRHAILRTGQASVRYATAEITRHSLP